MSTHVTQPTTPVGGARALWNRTERHRVATPSSCRCWCCFVVFRIWPTINGFLLSFQDYRLMGGSTWLGLEHYQYLLQDDLFWHSLRVTLTYAAIAVPLTTTLAMGLALLINQAMRGIGFYRAIYFLPYVTSLVMVAVIWKWVYRSDGGLLNNIFTSVGLPSVDWLTSATWCCRLAIMATWKGVGYAMMILLAGLKAIPDTLHEASAVERRTGAQTFWRVTLPLLKPVLFS